VSMKEKLELAVYSPTPPLYQDLLPLQNSPKPKKTFKRGRPFRATVMRSSLHNVFRACQNLLFHIHELWFGFSLQTFYPSPNSIHLRHKQSQNCDPDHSDTIISPHTLHPQPLRRRPLFTFLYSTSSKPPAPIKSNSSCSSATISTTPVSIPRMRVFRF